MTGKAAFNFVTTAPPLDRPSAPREPWTLAAKSGDVLIRPIRTEIASDEIQDPLYVVASLGGNDVTVKLSQNMLALFCQRREPGLEWQTISTAIKPLVLECLVQEFLVRLEDICGSVIEIKDVLDDAGAVYATNFACEIVYDNLVFPVGFQVAQSELVKLRLWQQTLPAASTMALNVPISIRMGAAVLSKTELHSLRVGDAIVLDVAASRAPVWAVTGEHFLSELVEKDDGFHLLTPLRSAPVTSMRHLMSDQSDQDHLFQPVEGAVGDIPIKLVFDVGRIEVPLAELEGIGVGHVFNVGRHPSRTIDIIAQGRIIGHGEIVAVEGVTAVRVTALSR